MTVERGGQLEVTLDLLAELLGLPPGSRVVSVVGDLKQQTLRRTVTVMVAHPDLPEIPVGAVPIRLVPHWEEMGTVPKLVDWGI